MKLKSILANLMTERDITLSVLSRATGVPKQTIHNWLCGTEPRALGHIHAVARYFGLTIEELCYGCVGGSSGPSWVSPIEQYRQEIEAGVFEVILRRT